MEQFEALRTDFSVRQICETLASPEAMYYHPKQDPCELELSLLYPTYGYRRITQLLVRLGYTVSKLPEILESVKILSNDAIA